ncbi:MAG: exo-alpha-sialidase [Phycisphaerales bacterium]|nr:exo-alpha-sialidase [Phycisphaerales bacterium]
MQKIILFLSFLCLIFSCKKNTSNGTPFVPFSGIGLAVGGDGQNGLYSYTTNMGKTWSNAQKIPVFNNGIINSVVFTSTSKAVAIGTINCPQCEIVYSYTTDAGLTWATGGTINSFSLASSMAFSSATNGVIVGSNSTTNQQLFSSTTDGGKTWSNAQPLSDGTLIPSSVAFSSATNGVVVGTNASLDQGLYSYTMDGGGLGQS